MEGWHYGRGLIYYRLILAFLGAIFPSSLPMRPRKRLNLIPSLLSPQKTLK